MDYQGELIVRDLISKSLNNLNISIPAVVVSTAKLSDGFVDVTPIVNYMNSNTRETIEYPTLHDIPLIFPTTKNSTICFPVDQGDYVSLVFQSTYVKSFSLGNTEIQDPPYPTTTDLSQAVALVGFVPFQQSCLNPNNYSGDFDNQDLNIVHNKNSGNEVSISLGSDGGVTIRSNRDVNVEASSVNIKGARVNVDNDLTIKGRSVFDFMLRHTHVDSKGGNTTPPTL